MLGDGAVKRGRPAVTVAVVAMVLLSGCSVLASPSPEVGFEDATAESGLSYEYQDRYDVGSGNAGVYVLDANDDDWPDLLTVGGDDPVLWLNREGRFERTDRIPTPEGYVKSAAVVDFDGDGLEDVVLFRSYDDPVALRNDGDSFERTDVGLDAMAYPLGAAAADYDGDGDQDLFVYQSGDWGEAKPKGYNSPYYRIDEDNGNPNVLYENVGGEYERVADAGIEGDRWSLAASFVDLTGDDRPDVHVANDFNNDVVYVNRGDGTFEQRVLDEATARNGMSSEVADFDGDGRPDVFTTNVEIPINRSNVSPERYERIERIHEFVIRSGRTDGNTLLVNQGNGTFAERGDEFGVRVGGWGWAASYADLDNDGNRELVHATENVVPIDRENPVYFYPMVFERDGDSFERLNSSARGLGQDDGRGLVTIDYDRDGDLEVVSANHGSTFTVYDNAATDPGNSLQFEVVDGDGDTAYGATVEVRAGGSTTTVFQHTRTDYLSREGSVRHVGLGGADSAELRVTWPDGSERTVEVDAGRIVRVSPSGVETVATTGE